MDKSVRFARAFFVTFALLLGAGCAPENTDTRDRNESLKKLRASGDDTCPANSPEVKASAFLMAARNGDVAELEKQLLSGIRVDLEVGLKKWTGLLCAVSGGQISVVQWFLNHGAKVDHSDSTGKTPLILAIQKQHSKIVDELLKAGSNPQTEWEVRSPLVWAVDRPASAERIRITDLLLQTLRTRGGTLDPAKFLEGQTALEVAATNSDEAMVDKLLAAGSHPARVDLTKIPSAAMRAKIESAWAPTARLEYSNGLTRVPLSKEEIEQLLSSEVPRRVFWTDIEDNPKIATAWQSYLSAFARYLSRATVSADEVKARSEAFKRVLTEEQSSGDPMQHSVAKLLIAFVDREPPKLSDSGRPSPTEASMVASLVEGHPFESLKKLSLLRSLAARQSKKDRLEFQTRQTAFFFDDRGDLDFTRYAKRNVSFVTDRWSGLGLKLREHEAVVLLANEYIEAAVKDYCENAPPEACLALQDRADSLRSEIHDVSTAMALADRAAKSAPGSAKAVEVGIAARIAALSRAMETLPLPAASSILRAFETEYSNLDRTSKGDKDATSALADLLATNKQSVEILSEALNEDRSRKVVAIDALADEVAQKLLTLGEEPKAPSASWLREACEAAIHILEKKPK